MSFGELGLRNVCWQELFGFWNAKDHLERLLDKGKTYAVCEAVTVRKISRNSEGTGTEHTDARGGREKTEDSAFIGDIRD